MLAQKYRLCLWPCFSLCWHAASDLTDYRILPQRSVWSSWSATPLRRKWCRALSVYLVDEQAWCKPALDGNKYVFDDPAELLHSLCLVWFTSGYNKGLHFCCSYGRSRGSAKTVVLLLQVCLILRHLSFNLTTATMRKERLHCHKGGQQLQSRRRLVSQHLRWPQDHQHLLDVLTAISPGWHK